MKSIDIYKNSNYLNNNIGKIKLSNEHYFLSLVKAAVKYKVFQQDEMLSIQVQMMKLLEQEIKRYTWGESSSVRVEVAESILLSIQYTIGLYLKDCGSIENCIAIINNNGLEAIYKKGKEKIDLLFKESKAMYDYMVNHKVKNDNYAYNDTIDQGIPPFFQEYDKKFASQEVPGSIDYPLYVLEIDLAGVEYIHEYLRRMKMENYFCSKFDEAEIELILKSYDKHSDELLINIANIVLLNAIGSVIAGKEAKNILLTKNDIESIQYKIKSNEEEMACFLKKSLKKVFVDLAIKEEEVKNYILSNFDEILLQVQTALKINKLNSIFIEVKEQVNIEKIAFVDRAKMNDDIFREVVEEIREAVDLKEKIGIIKNKINSLEDLIDVLDSDSIFDDEFIEVFNSLTDEEIALIIKYINLAESDSIYDDNRREWHNSLKAYINSLSVDRKNSIAEMTAKLI